WDHLLSPVKMSLHCLGETFGGRDVGCPGDTCTLWPGLLQSSGIFPIALGGRNDPVALCPPPRRLVAQRTALSSALTLAEPALDQTRRGLQTSRVGTLSFLELHHQWGVAQRSGGRRSPFYAGRISGGYPHAACPRPPLCRGGQYCVEEAPLPELSRRRC